MSEWYTQTSKWRSKWPSSQSVNFIVVILPNVHVSPCIQYFIPKPFIVTPHVPLSLRGERKACFASYIAKPGIHDDHRGKHVTMRWNSMKLVYAVDIHNTLPYERDSSE